MAIIASSGTPTRSCSSLLPFDCFNGARLFPSRGCSGASFRKAKLSVLPAPLCPPLGHLHPSVCTNAPIRHQHAAFVSSRATHSLTTFVHGSTCRGLHRWLSIRFVSVPSFIGIYAGLLRLLDVGRTNRLAMCSSGNLASVHRPRARRVLSPYRVLRTEGGRVLGSAFDSLR